MRPHILCIFVLSLSSTLVSDLAQAGSDVLVEGDPPLTEETMQQDIVTAEWYLGRSFTDEERDQWKKVVTSYWPKRDKAERESIIKNDRDVATAYNRWSPYQRDLNRAVYLRSAITQLRNSKADPERWFLTKLEAAYRPGGERNPIVVPGDPPLTRFFLDQNLALIEYAFEFNLSAAERHAYEKLVIEGWRQTDRQNKERTIQDRQRAIGPLSAQNLERDRFATQWLAALQTYTAPDDQWLLGRCKKSLSDPSSELSRRIGPYKIIEPISNSVVLVEGDPPLTEATMQQDIMHWEWYLGRSFTDEERDQWEEVVTTYWPKRDKAEREKIIKDHRDSFTAYSQWSAYERDRVRALSITKGLEYLRSLNGDPERWIVTKLETAYWPGGKRNPILVPGDPPLTRLLLDKNVAMIEFAFALNLSAAERGAYEKTFIGGWRQHDRKIKGRFIRDQESLISALAESKLNPIDVAQRWLAVLRTSPHPADRWLLTQCNKALSRPSSTLSMRMFYGAIGDYMGARAYSDLMGAIALPAIGTHLRK